MTSTFFKYAAIGVINTLVHWLVFGAVYWTFASQTAGNLLGFLAAVTFSFFANARWTFKSEATPTRYLTMTTFMAILSSCFGYAADRMAVHPLITLTAFSATSLVAGFLFSKFWVFRN